MSEIDKPFMGSGYAAQFGLSVAEAPAYVSSKKYQMYIGIPRERTFQENRIALTPDAVDILVANGHHIVIESKAGEGAHFTDNDYSEAGAEITHDTKKIFDAEIILKVAPPSNEEIELLHANQILISPLHLPTLKDTFIQSLMNKKVTAMALEYIKDDVGSFPFVRSMSEIAGSSAIQIAAELLNSTKNGQGLLLGGISGVPPANILILGAGVVGEFATRAALGLGASVKIFDNNTYKLMRLQNNVGGRLYTSAMYPDVVQKELEDADVVVGAIHSESGRTPILVSEEMVSLMKPGAVIIDVSIDQGGIFETSEITSHQNPTFKKYDVIHYCVPNIASRVARTASYAMSNILSSRLLKSTELGGIDKLFYYDYASRHGVYIYKGCLTNRHLSERFNIKYTNMDLLFAHNM